MKRWKFGSRRQFQVSTTPPNVLFSTHCWSGFMQCNACTIYLCLARGQRRITGHYSAWWLNPLFPLFFFHFEKKRQRNKVINRHERNMCSSSRAQLLAWLGVQYIYIATCAVWNPSSPFRSVSLQLRMVRVVQPRCQESKANYHYQGLGWLRSVVLIDSAAQIWLEVQTRLKNTYVRANEQKWNE